MFGLVGGLGFIVDAGVLYLLKDPLGLYVARAMSFLAAASFTWLLNRSITFRQHGSKLSLRREFVVYMLLMLLGGSVNYGVFAALVLMLDTVRDHPVIGVAAGSLAGMLINLASSRFLLFRHPQPDAVDSSKPSTPGTRA